MFTHINTSTFGPIKRSKLDLMGIRFLEGEGSGGDGAGSGSEGQGGKGQQPNGASGDNAPWTKDNFDPERAWRLTENLRNDIATQKTKTDAAIAAAAEKAKKDTLAEFGRLLSGGEVEETDPAKLKAKVTDLSTQIQSKDTALTTAQADIKARDLSLAVALAAPALGANTKLLLANEQFKTSVASVEPTDEAAITAAITTALQANAALKATPARSGGGEHTGATVQTLEAQLKAAEEKKDVKETIRLTRAIAAAKTAPAQ